MPITKPATENAHRRRIMETCYQSIVAAVYKIRKRYRTSFQDIDLTLEDLSQYGALKAIEGYDRLFAADPDRVLLMPEDLLKKDVVGLALRCIACHIIDVYRMRDRRRDTIAPDELISQIDDSDMRRVDLWRRLEPVMASVTARQRAIVVSLWQGLETEEIGSMLGLSTNVVQKDISAIRRVAVC
jgi:RNA polymerase sigma factor (sigma-70 family)